MAILCRGELAKGFTDTPIYVAGSGAATDYLAIHDRKEITRLTAATLAAKQAYEQAGFKPEDIDVAEVHDATSFGELHQTEALGFCPQGEGGPFADSGATRLGGKIPINTSGGLESRGHPIGASGLAQLYELTTQLRHEAGERQVENCRLALAENGGGNLGLEEASMCIHILERVDS